MFKIGGQTVTYRTVLLVLSDVILILLSLLLATSIRFVHWKAISAHLSQPGVAYRILLVVGVCELALYYHDLYDIQVVRDRSELFVRLFQAIGTACLGLAILYFTDPDHSLGRGIFVITAPLVLLLLLTWRLTTDHLGLFLLAPQRILVVGTGRDGISLVREIIRRPELNLKVVGFLDEKGEHIGESLVNPRIIGGVAELEAVASREKVDRVVLSLAERRGNMPVRQLLDLKFAGTSVEDAHSVWEQISGRIPIERLSPSWLILSQGFRKPKILIAVKRATDFVVAAIGTILSMPIMILTALTIWIETGSPILFRQERTGMNGRPFEILKFRSMKQNAEQNGPAWAKEKDDRTTRVGRLIRKLRFDELPQFINVLRGEMSLVGPRPERPVFCELLEQEIPFYVQRQSVRPGLTGWAQIKYQYGSSVEESRTKLEYDLFYIKHMSILLDLVIMFETVKVLITGRGAK